MQIGNYEIYALETGYFALDGGAMFGVVPKVIWEKSHPADALNRIDMALRILLLRDENHVILIDTGIGDKFAPKYTEMYKINHEQNSLKQALASHDLTPEDITHVILTHLHFDHAGGATEFREGLLVPTFPQARYITQKSNWDWANHPSEKDRASYLKENFVPLMEAGQLDLIDGEIEILPQIFAWKSEGHTVGQQLIQIKAPEQTLMYCADIIPTASHLSLPFVMGYDLYPLTTIQEKKAILNQAAAEDWILIFEHDATMHGARVKQSEKGVILKEAVTI